MKYLKLYEHKELKVGDYVILRNADSIVLSKYNIDIINNHIGMITDILKFKNYTRYEVVYSCNYLRVEVPFENIVAYGTKEEIETQLNINKYNL